MRWKHILRTITASSSKPVLALVLSLLLSSQHTQAESGNVTLYNDCPGSVTINVGFSGLGGAVQSAVVTVPSGSTYYFPVSFVSAADILGDCCGSHEPYPSRGAYHILIGGYLTSPGTGAGSFAMSHPLHETGAYGLPCDGTPALGIDNNGNPVSIGLGGLGSFGSGSGPFGGIRGPFGIGIGPVGTPDGPFGTGSDGRGGGPGC